MYVVGTAGHVDHGKSTLVKALTGIDPDRWEEEKRREMTIDLGFAWVTLPSGRNVSIIDVPGHERFIKNMLAGVGGIDAALLVVAADESVMPQTEEHLAILDLLSVERGLVVITKADLVDDEWLMLVQDEIAQRLAGTTLAAAPRVVVSARTGAGLPELLTTLDQVLDATPSRAGASGIPRLPVDRSFTVGGFGTVVTGTLLDGPLTVGQEVEVLPQGLRARVRGLQSHRQRIETARPGTRVAVNLAGVHHAQVDRGDMLTVPGGRAATSLLDVRLRLLPGIPRPLEHNTRLELFLGAAEVRCHAALLDREVLEPGETAWVQLRLERPVVAVRGDRCILRQPSPSLTVGGGVIIDPHPRRHRRFRADVLTALNTMARGAPDELLLQALGTGRPVVWEDLLRTTGLSAEVAREVLVGLQSAGRVLVLADSVLVSAQGWQRLAAESHRIVQSYHRRFPLRRGMPREEFRQRLGLDARIMAAVLGEAARAGVVQFNETSVWEPAHTPTLTPDQRREVDAMLTTMARSPYSPPRPALDPEVLTWALDHELLVRVSADVFFLPSTYAEMLEWVRETLAQLGSISVAAFRDRFGSSRKYALAFLEHLDERKITRRSGDVRVPY